MTSSSGSGTGGGARSRATRCRSTSPPSGASCPAAARFSGSSRTNPYTADDGERRVLDTCERLGVEALVVIGGEDTLGVATKLSATGLPVVGVPKTIDNDLGVPPTTRSASTRR